MKGMAKGIDRKGGLSLLCALALLTLAGCQGNGEAIQPVSAQLPPKPDLKISADQGVPVAKGQPVDARSMPEARNLVARNDAWALTPEEAAFNSSQMTESFLSRAGGFATEVDLETRDIQPDPPRVRPVPAWRLSGVIVGQGVMALLDMGTQTIEIRPGTHIPGTEWYVVAIDSEKATLRRDGIDIPHEFQVGLAGPIGGVPVQGRGNAQGGTAGGGNTQGGGKRGGAMGGGGNGIDN